MSNLIISTVVQLGSIDSRRNIRILSTSIYALSLYISTSVTNCLHECAYVHAVDSYDISGCGHLIMCINKVW